MNKDFNNSELGDGFKPTERPNEPMWSCDRYTIIFMIGFALFWIGIALGLLK